VRLFYFAPTNILHSEALSLDLYDDAFMLDEVTEAEVAEETIPGAENPEE